MNIQPSDVVINFMRRGGSLRMLAKMNPQDLALVYEYTVQLCEGGEYDGAKRLLNLLVRLDHWNFSYWLTLGLCYQQTADFHQAIYCFSRAGQIQVNDPRPSYLAAECYTASGNLAYAEKSLSYGTELVLFTRGMGSSETTSRARVGRLTIGGATCLMP